MKKHWLFGDLKYNVEVDKETNCYLCIHVKVCNRSEELRCSNYWFGDSRYKDCHSCTHHFARWNKQPIPCFHCKDFVLNNKLKKALTKKQKPTKFSFKEK